MNILNVFVDDLPSDINPEFKRWIKDINHNFITCQMGSPNFSKTFEEAIASALETEADYCMAHSALNVVFNFSELGSLLMSEYGSQEFLLAGHIEEGGRPNSACVFVNLKEIRKLGLKPSELSIENLANISKERNLPIHQFSRDMAENMAHIPKNNHPEKPWNYLSQIKNLTYNQIETLSDQSWIRVFKYLHGLYSDRKKVIYLMNTESLDAEPVVPEKVGPVDKFYFLASGFKSIYLMSVLDFHKKTSVVFYDISTPALTLKKFLVENWDGTDFVIYLKQILDSQDPSLEEIQKIIKTSSDLTHKHLLFNRYQWHDSFQFIERRWEELMSKVGGAERFRQLWQNLKEMKVEYREVDLINSFEDLALNRVNGSAVIWCSNVYNYSDTIIPEGGLRNLFHTFIRFLRYAESENPETYLIGEVPCMVSLVGDRVDRVRTEALEGFEAWNKHYES